MSLKKTYSILAFITAFLCGGFVEASSHAGARIQVVGHEDAYVRIFSTDDMLRRSMYLYSDRHDKAHREFPSVLDGCLYYELPKAYMFSYRCLERGSLFALSPVNEKADQELERAGFSRMTEIEPFQLYGDNPAGVFGVFRRQVKTGETFDLPVGTIVTGFNVERNALYGDPLYNGIRLPREWPPKYEQDLWMSGDVLPVPYLENPPSLIPIDTGRQLFVDDFLIEETALTREYHYPEKYEHNPVLKPETALEHSGVNGLVVAGPKSGGLWWNSEKQLFEFWYETGWVSSIGYATSPDGLVWDRPDLPLKPGTNQVLPDEVKPDSWTVVKDYRAVNPAETYKIFLRGGGSRDRARAFLSEDGIDWGKHIDCGTTGDRSTMFYNPFRNVWVYSLRWTTTGFGGRCRSYWESDDFMKGMHWYPDEPVRWARTDKIDPPDPRIGDKPQLYNLDAVAYESILLGFFEILHGPPNDVNAALGLPKNTGLNFAYSRDGFHWHRPDRSIAINSEQRDVWDRGYVQSLGNICTVRGDKLWFYYIGFAGDESLKYTGPDERMRSSMWSGLYANGATGVAFLRRDGFVSLNAENKAGTVTTRPVTFSGKHLFVNADVPQGTLRAEVIDMKGNPVEPFTLANSIAFTGDSTLTQLRWKGGDDLTSLAGRAVRFRFQVENGKFYSFWVSRDATGRSDGYVAGGGPGFTSDIDTVGRASLEAEAKVKPQR